MDDTNIDALIDEILSSENSLSHYGVRGMRWGVRRDRSERGSSKVGRGGKFTKEDGIKPKGSVAGKMTSKNARDVQIELQPGKRPKTSGGDANDASTDAIRAAILKQRASKSTVASLSSVELKELVNRMQLEKQYNDLNPPKKTVVDFAKSLAADTAKNEVTAFVKSGGQSPGPALKIALGAKTKGGAATTVIKKKAKKS